MAVTIQIKRGTKAGLPALAPGEYGLATDTGELFVGGNSGNIQVATLSSDGKIPEGLLPEMDYDPAGSAAAVQTNLTSHVNNKNNPHGVTAAQVGAYTKEESLAAATAGLYGLGSDAVPDDVFNDIYSRLIMIAQDKARLIVTVKDASGARTDQRERRRNRIRG